MLKYRERCAIYGFKKQGITVLTPEVSKQLVQQIN